MMCDCRKRIDEQLATHNTRVMQVFSLTDDNETPWRWPITTERVEKKRGAGKPPLLFASHCPFCGEELK